MVRVLIADDYPDAAESLALCLASAGLTTRCAYDGQEALDIANEWQPDVCVLDLGMPQLDGYQLARELRTAKWAESCLLVAVTGWATTEYERRAQRAGFDCYLRKPVPFDDLITVISRKAPVHRSLTFQVMHGEPRTR